MAGLSCGRRALTDVSMSQNRGPYPLKPLAIVSDNRADYGILETRQLLIDFVGGEPGAMLRDQFA
jgi:hypothetical protein